MQKVFHLQSREFRLLLLHSGHLNMIVVIVIMIIRVAQLAASLHPGWEKMERE